MNTKPEQQLSEIMDLMERSSRFISLSGLSGVVAGVVALLGAIFAFFYLDYDLRYLNPDEYFGAERSIYASKVTWVLIADAVIVFGLAVSLAIYFTSRKAKKQKHKIWTHSTRQLLLNLFIPIFAGAVFSFVLLYYNIVYLIAPATLVFYGLGLINASKYTLHEIRWLGLTELSLGLLAAIFTGYGLLAWALGFGVFHIIYGLIMYTRYERQTVTN